MLINLINFISFSLILNRIVDINMLSLIKTKTYLLYTIANNNYNLYIPSLILEIISIGFRSVSLGFRVVANFSAGHVLGDLLQIIKYVPINNSLAFISETILLSIHILYENIVATIQLLILCALLAVYLEVN